MFAHHYSGANFSAATLFRCSAPSRKAHPSPLEKASIHIYSGENVPARIAVSANFLCDEIPLLVVPLLLLLLGKKKTVHPVYYMRRKCPPRCLTPLGPQSRFGDKLLGLWMVCPQNGTAVLKGLIRVLIPVRVHHQRRNSAVPLLLPSPTSQKKSFLCLSWRKRWSHTDSEYL